MGSHIMSAHIMNKTLLMEFLQSARKKKIIKAADRKFKLEKFILGKKKMSHLQLEKLLVIWDDHWGKAMESSVLVAVLKPSLDIL